MDILDPGHQYRLAELDILEHPLYYRQTLTFVKREGEKYPGNIGHHTGTTIQEVIRVLINRIKYVDSQIHFKENEYALRHLRRALYELEVRANAAADYPSTMVGFDSNCIEIYDTCDTCGHIWCNGGRHRAADR